MISALVLSVIAALMVLAIIGVLVLAANAKSYSRVYFVYFLLGMMALMFFGAVLYLLSPSEESLEIAFGVNMVYMLIVLSYYFIIAEEIAGRNVENLKLHSAAMGILIVINEALMGATFTLAQFGRKLFVTPSSSLYYSINSYWFFYPMMAEMLGLFIYHLTKGYLFRSVFALIEMTAFPPTVFTSHELVYASVALTIASCALGFLYSRDKLWKTAYVAIALSAALALVSPYPYDAAIIASMVYYFYTTIGVKAKSYSEKKFTIS